MKIQNKELKAWESVCDANSNGQLDDSEIKVFNEGLKTYWKCESDKDYDTVRVGNVTLNPRQIKTIKSGTDFDYEVTFKNGVVVEYNKQEDKSVNAIRSKFKRIGNILTQFFKRKETETQIAGIRDKKGVKVTGTPLKDFINVEESTISSIDSGGETDTVLMYKSKGTPDKERAPIYAEKLYITRSSHFVARSATDSASWQRPIDYYGQKFERIKKVKNASAEAIEYSDPHNTDYEIK